MNNLSDYDYTLPQTAIAQTPLEDRASARMLYLHGREQLEHRIFRDIVDILLPGDLLVLNNTRVTALRLSGRRSTGGAVELLLLKRLSETSFEALTKPAKRLKPGTEVRFLEGFSCVVTEDLGEGRKAVEFVDSEDLDKKLAESGQVPLPPYITQRLENPARYQTVYNEVGGSAAAPTAGLHFTPEILNQLEEKRVHLAYVTLDVGIDTFKPVQSENLDEHQMHGETCTVPAETKQAIENCSGRVVAVGTTTVRTLETFASGKRQLESGSGVSKLFIKPGYEFKVVDGMLTNFHLPRTTMLLMLSAMVGRERLFRAYEVALNEGYRFLSFGDAMLILPT